MFLLFKWLRPEYIPSPTRKNVPLGTRLRIFLYRRHLKVLRRWYARYAFSDTVVISGHPSIKIYHECRDIGFEAELKRLRLSVPEYLINRSGGTSSHAEKKSRRAYLRAFHLKDTFRLDIDGQKVSIDHGQGRSFISTFKGNLKESDNTAAVARYVFSGAIHERKSSQHRIESAHKPAPGERSHDHRTGGRTRTGALFDGDPLFGILSGNNPDKTESVSQAPDGNLKKLEGVTIDESF